MVKRKQIVTSGRYSSPEAQSSARHFYAHTWSRSPMQGLWLLEKVVKKTVVVSAVLMCNICSVNFIGLQTWARTPKTFCLRWFLLLHLCSAPCVNFLVFLELSLAPIVALYIAKLDVQWWTSCLLSFICLPSFNLSYSLI